MISTTYIHKQLSYYFTRNQILDLQIGHACKISMNQCLDILEQSMSISSANNGLNMKYKLLQACLGILDHLISYSMNALPYQNHKQNQNQRQLHLQMTINTKQYEQFYQNDGIRCCVFALKGYLDYLTNTNTNTNVSNNTNTNTNMNMNSNSNNSSMSASANNISAAPMVKISIIDEMIVKSLMNMLYIALYGHCSVYAKINANTNTNTNTNTNSKGNDDNSIFKSKSTSKSTCRQQCMKTLKQLTQELQLDSLLIRMVTLTLQVYYLPIKKLVMLYTRVLSILFYDFKDFKNSKQSQAISISDIDNIQIQTLNMQHLYQQQQLYSDIEMLQLCSKNQLSQNYLKEFRQKNKPQDIKSINKNNPIEQFYSKHNVGDCPLAQSIVVGLLRSLLTICNSQVHKKFQASPSKGSGADSYREWQISYQFFIQCEQLQGCRNYQECLSDKAMAMLRDYVQYNQLASQGTAEKQVSANVASIPTHFQFYRHKIYTTSAISTFFTFLLVSFKKNAMIQFTYLYQLISDANGILVFLKFLTDKFQCLEPVPENVRMEQNKEQIRMSGNTKNTSKKFVLAFKNQVMLTVYSVLMVLYGACNNYAEKTRSYLFEYNSYLIIKKIPHIFMKVHKNDDELPSQQQIQAQFGKNTQNAFKISQQQNSQPNCITEKVKQLTQLCYSLLKIQIPFFSKKMKQNANNMKMIVQIYCQMPKKIQPIKRTELDKLLLKNQMRKIHHEKYILSVQELKSIHNEYNNLYYWSNQEAKINEANEKSQENVQVPLSMTREEMQNWLEQNVWKFYD